MMRKILLILFGFAIASQTFAQQKTDTAALKKQLAALHERDQRTRRNDDSAKYMYMIDSMNLIEVEAIIAKYGWPGKSFVGNRGNNTVFLVIQHSNLQTQEKYLPMLMQSVADSQSRPCDLALMQDRVLMWQGKKQIYGSQVVRNGSESWHFHPIEDEINVNERRKRMGLEPIEEYARYFGIEYKAPEK